MWHLTFFDTTKQRVNKLYCYRFLKPEEAARFHYLIFRTFLNFTLLSCFPFIVRIPFGFAPFQTSCLRCWAISGLKVQSYVSIFFSKVFLFKMLLRTHRNNLWDHQPIIFHSKSEKFIMSANKFFQKKICPKCFSGHAKCSFSNTH